MRAALPLTLTLALLGCGDDAADLQSQIDALQRLTETQAEAISALEAEVAALSGGVDLTDLEASIEQNAEEISANESAITTLRAEADDDRADIAGNAEAIDALAAEALTSDALDGYATESWVRAQGYGDDAVAGLAGYLSVDAGTDSVVFSGANVYVQSGTGSTEGALNGLGNLIVGYDEDNGDDKSGAHNLVVGANHTYASYGGVVAGYDNAVSGQYASVTGGAENTASGDHAAVTGGAENTASGDWSAVHGGVDNAASGSTSAVLAGYRNVATTNWSVVAGGYRNYATGNYSVVSGGYYNTASGTASAIGGGENETATGNYDFAP